MNQLIKLLLCIGIIIYLFILYQAITSSIQKQVPPSEKAYLVPYQTSLKATCTYTKTSCDPNVPNDCQNKCADPNAASLKCVNLDDYQPSGSNTNGGGYVCLPLEPDTSCNVTNGGASVWTGYGMTNQQSWSCLCTQPHIYNGQHCTIKNPSYCSGGTIDLTKSGDQICTCPSNTVKMYRAATNTPFCASTNPSSGGAFGLAGNYVNSPNWMNLYHNPNQSPLNNNDGYSKWANKIGLEADVSNNPDTVRNIALAIKTASGNSTTSLLNDTILNAVCNVTGMAGNILCVSNAPGRTNYSNAGKYVTYTYYDQSYYS